MEIEGEILGFVMIFLVVSAGFYFFIIRDWGSEDSLPDEDNASGELINQSLNDTLIGNETIVDNESLGNESERGMNFSNIEELHWDHMPLTYHFVNNASSCEGFPIDRMKEAFAIIEEESGGKVNFTEVNKNESADINLTCVDYEAALEELEEYEKCMAVVLDYRTVEFSGYEVLDEGSFVTSLTAITRNDTSNIYEVCYVETDSVGDFDIELLMEAEPVVEDGVIVSARKSVYSAGTGKSYCVNFPAKEVHDVLHIFGFAHSKTPTFHEYYGWFFKDLRYFKDIMFPYPFCAYITEMNDNYGGCLEYIYSNGESGDVCGGVNFIS